MLEPVSGFAPPSVYRASSAKNTFMSSEWPPPRSVTTEPVGPVCATVGCVCESCPSAGCTMICEGSTAPSASVTATSQSTRSPQSMKPPFTGCVKLTCGRELPTVIGTTVVPVFPTGSWTVSRAL